MSPARPLEYPEVYLLALQVSGAIASLETVLRSPFEVDRLAAEARAAEIRDRLARFDRVMTALAGKLPGAAASGTPATVAAALQHRANLAPRRLRRGLRKAAKDLRRAGWVNDVRRVLGPGSADG